MVDLKSYIPKNISHFVQVLKLYTEHISVRFAEWMKHVQHRFAYSPNKKKDRTACFPHPLLFKLSDASTCPVRGSIIRTRFSTIISSVYPSFTPYTIDPHAHVTWAYMAIFTTVCLDCNHIRHPNSFRRTKLAK